VKSPEPAQGDARRARDSARGQDRREHAGDRRCSPPTGSKTSSPRSRPTRATGRRPSWRRSSPRARCRARSRSASRRGRQPRQLRRGDARRICARGPGRPHARLPRGRPRVADRQGQHPQWDPPTPEQVDDEMLDVLFAPLPPHEQWTPFPETGE
jgi:hypothetical protein